MRTATLNGAKWTVGANVLSTQGATTYNAYRCVSIDRAHLLLTAITRLYAAVAIDNAIDRKRIDQLMHRLDRQRRGSRP